jgi:hypothetical protein|tara:strand:- start:3730 stop:4101 length:372 start_codon:yes stop_codon:yes gene_type:complete
MSYIDKRPTTIFCDIDGTLVIHSKPTESQLPTHKLNLLEGTIEKILEWDKLGYNIILTTGRKESLRKVTEQQLAEVGIIYDQLIMGIGGGKRYIINDKKPYGTENYAFAINLERNKGIKNIEI